MEHLVFVFWMMFYPISWELCDYISIKSGKKQKEFSDNTNSYSALILVFIWLFVGYHLF